MLTLVVRCGIDLQQRTAIYEYAIVLQEGQVGLDLGNTPEFGLTGDGVTGLQDKLGRGGADVTQLDDLDGAGSSQFEPFDTLRRIILINSTIMVAVYRLQVIADIQLYHSTDIDNRLIGETKALEFDTTGYLDIEDLT